MSKEWRLNAQGMARRDAGLMTCILPEPGYIFCSSDAGSGEPTATAWYSKDKNYYDATFGMVGKEPYYEGRLLKIDDIYLTVMSVSPVGQERMRTAFAKTYNGFTFSQQWLIDPEVIKKELNEDRKIHKILCLGLGYGMGAKKAVKQMYENGFNLTLKQARDFHRAYWSTFSGVKKLADTLSQQVEQDGYIVNPFGYRLSPEPNKAFNYYIQSSISGIFHAYCAKIFAAAPWAKFVTIIHDELIAEVPIDRQDDFRQVIKDATDSLNADLGWEIRMRFGAVFGDTFYSAK